MSDNQVEDQGDVGLSNTFRAQENLSNNASSNSANQHDANGNNNQQDLSISQLIAESMSEMVSKLSDATLSTALLNISPPEYSGFPEDDIYEWLGKFERLTLGLPTDQKCTLLEKAFTRSARSWFTDELLGKTNGKDWSSIKQTILDRFSGRKAEDRYYDKLISLRYSKNEHGSLLSFADEFVHVYRRAYSNASDPDIVRACVLAIPSEYRGYLNLIRNLATISTVKDLKDTLRRYDQDIKIAPQASNSNPIINMEEFKKIMTGVVKELVDQQATKTEETVAAFAKRYDNRRSNQYATNNNMPRKNPNSNINARPGSFYNEIGRPVRRNGGAPPSPCYHCGEMHWNCDCLLRSQNRKQNLNGQGC